MYALSSNNSGQSVRRYFLKTLEKKNEKWKKMIDRCMCGYPPIILVHLSVGARAFSIILSAAHHQQNNIMLWINQSLIYVLSKKIQNGIEIGFRYQIPFNLLVLMSYARLAKGQHQTYPQVKDRPVRELVVQLLDCLVPAQIFRQTNILLN